MRLHEKEFHSLRDTQSAYPFHCTLRATLLALKKPGTKIYNRWMGKGQEKMVRRRGF